eukprot:5545734-Pleurochrysis_carterae.AAC.1
MTVRQSRLLEQLDRRCEKLANLNLETERISAKEIEGLSEGQRAALERNEQRSRDLKHEIESLEDQISESIREQLGAKRALEGGADGSKGGAKGRSRQGAARGGPGPESDDDDDGDDFFDRTGGGKKKRHLSSASAKIGAGGRGHGAGTGRGVEGGGGEVESEATLRAKLQAALAERLACVGRVEALKIEMMRESAAAGAGEDPLEAYMHANKVQVGKGKLAEEESRLGEIEDECGRLSRVLAF